MPDAYAPSYPSRSPQPTRDANCDNTGVVAGWGTPLVRMEKGRLAVEEDGARCLALLSVLCEKSLGPEVLHPIEAAAAYWAAGEKALANLRLVFSDLPKLGSAADAYRLEAAAYCLDRGLTPRELMKTLGLDPSFLQKFDPDQPRVPAGSGRASGRWIGSGDALSPDTQFVPTSPKRIRIAANGPFKPEGIETVPSQSVDPLDPANLNKVPPTPQEQQAISDTLNIITNGTPEEVKKLQPHSYRNLPSNVTGAVLPPDLQGYKSYNVHNSEEAGRGLKRLVLNGSGDRAYYTPNHYQSFFAVDISK